MRAALSGGRDDLKRAMYRLAPVVDGRSLPRDPFDPDAPAISADIPMMVGAVETDGSYFAEVNMLDISETRMHEELQKRFGSDTDRVIEVFRKNRPKATPSELYFTITSFPMNAILQS